MRGAGGRRGVERALLVRVLAGLTVGVLPAGLLVRVLLLLPARLLVGVGAGLSVRSLARLLGLLWVLPARLLVGVGLLVRVRLLPRLTWLAGLLGLSRLPGVLALLPRLRGLLWGLAPGLLRVPVVPVPGLLLSWPHAKQE
ncbi:hypothetical protein [Streptomyces sp. NPDC005438]|uniref:hypothetical protein n=1 Tax=Streptomyces sp. NPDC005438 TaxID=3156880 RepID=UPI0033B0ECBE